MFKTLVTAVALLALAVSTSTIFASSLPASTSTSWPCRRSDYVVMATGIFARSREQSSREARHLQRLAISKSAFPSLPVRTLGGRQILHLEIQPAKPMIVRSGYLL